MIHIDIILDETGLLRSCSVIGHAKTGKTGANIVCAAVTVLIRSFAQVLYNKKGITVKSKAPEPGNVWLETGYTAEGSDFLSACTDFLITGLRSVADEYPANCRMNIVSERRI
jgi:uncharacterized protein YsxB (DUF464 family)